LRACPLSSALEEVKSPWLIATLWLNSGRWEIALRRAGG
jgi:hypothetical protein